MKTIHTFAIEPGVLAKWQNFQSLWSDFGAQNGRLIAEYPPGWRKKVRTEAFSPGLNQPLKANAIADKVREDKYKIVPCVQPYDSNFSWQENCTRFEALRCVLVEKREVSPAHCISIGELDKDAPPYLVPKQSETLRTNEAISDLLSDLIRSSTRLTLIDPYFSAGDDRFFQTLNLILQKNRSLKEVAIHCLPSTYDPNVQSHHSRANIQPYLDVGCVLRIHHWRQKLGGELPHGRFAITDLGAIQLDPGLDRGHKGEMVQWSLLEYEYSRQVLKKYDVSSGVFDLLPDGIVEFQG